MAHSISSNKLFSILGDDIGNYKLVSLGVKGHKILFLQAVMYSESVIMRTSMSDDTKWFGIMTHFVQIPSDLILFLKAITKDRLDNFFFSLTSSCLKISTEKNHVAATEIKRSEFADSDGSVLWSSVILFNDLSKEKLRSALSLFDGSKKECVEKDEEEEEEEEEKNVENPEVEEESESEDESEEGEGEGGAEEGEEDEEQVKLVGGKKKAKTMCVDAILEEETEWVEFSRDCVLFVKKGSFRYSIPVVHEHGVSKSIFALSVKSFCNILDIGAEFVSDMICKMQEHVLGKGAGEYSHVGVVFLGKDFPKFSPYFSETAIYVFESTQGGCTIGDGVCDVNGQSRLGVQLRCLDKLAEIYDSHPKSRMAWGQMKYKIQVCPDQVLRVFRKYNGLDYDMSIIDLLAAAFPIFRPLRTSCFLISGNKESWQFCSELAANIYKDFGILDKDIVADDVLPGDFVETYPGSDMTFDRDGMIPSLFYPNVLFTTRPKTGRVEIRV